MMQIKKARFVTSLTAYGKFEGRGMPEVAAVGRSNVGKSSLINKLCGRGGLAKVSQTPGKTRMINLFNLNENFMLVDLPGYGFAQVSQQEKSRWTGMIEGYFNDTPFLRRVLLLVDLRHEPGREDVMMANYLRALGVPFTVVATKADKLSGAQKGRSLPAICRGLLVQPWEVIPFSSETGEGRDALLNVLEETLREKDRTLEGFQPSKPPDQRALGPLESHLPPFGRGENINNTTLLF